MVDMYKDVQVKVSENIKINNHPFYAENISSDEAFNRRELNRNSILGGTEVVTKGRYIPRSYSFTTTIYHPTNRPDAFEKILKEIVANPAEIISPYMGGKFKAEVIIQKNIEESSPNHMVLDFTVTEIPNRKSNIPGEKFTVPKPKKVKITTTSTSKKSSSEKAMVNAAKKIINKTLKEASKKKKKGK